MYHICIVASFQIFQSFPLPLALEVILKTEPDHRVADGGWISSTQNCIPRPLSFTLSPVQFRPLNNISLFASRASVPLRGSPCVQNLYMIYRRSGAYPPFQNVDRVQCFLGENGSERTASALKGVGIAMEATISARVVSRGVAWMPFELTFFRRSISIFAVHCGLIAWRALLP